MRPFSKTALHFGTYSGLAGFGVFILLHLSGMNPLGRASWWGAWIPVVFICIATRQSRDKVLGGFISYWQGFRAGFLTAFFGAVLYALLIYIYGRLADPELVSRYQQELMTDLETTRMFFSQEMFDQATESIDSLHMAGIAYNDFFMKSLGGAIVSFIAAAVYRKLPKPE